MEMKFNLDPIARMIPKVGEEIVLDAGEGVRVVCRIDAVDMEKWRMTGELDMTLTVLRKAENG